MNEFLHDLKLNILQGFDSKNIPKLQNVSMVLTYYNYSEVFHGIGPYKK